MTTINVIEASEQLRRRFNHNIINETDFLEQKSIEVNRGELKAILSFLQPSFEVLMDLTAADYVEPTKRTKLIYLLHNPTNYERLIITTFVERDGIIPTVVDLWEGADWYEREL